jgi:hypothetical protein
MTYEWKGTSPAPDFDETLAATYIGKYILIGITYCENDGTLSEQLQMHGIIKSATHDGISIDLLGPRQGETWVMPPALEAITQAKPGIYTLRSTGEEIENPDLLSTWTITKPPRS